jgi:hypothetical protein
MFWKLPLGGGWEMPTLMGPFKRANSITDQCKSKSKLYYDRQSVGQSVLVSGTHLWVGYLVAPSLTRELVCNLLLLLVLVSAVPLGSESRGTEGHILLSQFLRDPQPGGPGPRIYIPQQQGGPDIPPGTGFPFRRLLRLAGTTVEVFYPTSTREQPQSKLKLKLIYDQQSVGQSVLVSGTHLGPATNFSFSLKFLLDSCGFVIL